MADRGNRRNTAGLKRAGGVRSWCLLRGLGEEEVEAVEK